ELEPALVPALVREASSVGPAEFTATLFDLIRRGAYTATPVTTQQNRWGGLRHESVADLEIRKGPTRDKLTSYERSGLAIVDGVVEDKGERLTEFRERIAADRTGNAKRFDDFKSRAAESIRKRKWYDDRGRLVL